MKLERFQNCDFHDFVLPDFSKNDSSFLNGTIYNEPHTASFKCILSNIFLNKLFDAEHIVQKLGMHIGTDRTGSLSLQCIPQNSNTGKIIPIIEEFSLPVQFNHSLGIPTVITVIQALLLNLC